MQQFYFLAIQWKGKKLASWISAHPSSLQNYSSSKHMEKIKISLNGWMDKENVAYIHSGILFSHEKWNCSICDNMNESGGYYVKWNKPDRER